MIEPYKWKNKNNYNGIEEILKALEIISNQLDELINKQSNTQSTRPFGASPSGG